MGPSLRWRWAVGFQRCEMGQVPTALKELPISWVGRGLQEGGASSVQSEVCSL